MNTDPTSTREVKDIIRKNPLVFLKIGAAYCVPCKKIQPCFGDLASEYSSKAKFMSIEIDSKEHDFSDIKSEFNVKSLPTFRVYKQGKQVDEYIGSVRMDLVLFITKYLRK